MWNLNERLASAVILSGIILLCMGASRCSDERTPATYHATAGSGPTYAGGAGSGTTGSRDSPPVASSSTPPKSDRPGTRFEGMLK